MKNRIPNKNKMDFPLKWIEITAANDIEKQNRIMNVVMQRDCERRNEEIRAA